MKILAIDSSGVVASVAIVDEEKIICEYTINYKKTHSQTLLPMIQEICNDCELDMQSIDAVAVASGPGSFTGLRIGSATAKGIAHGLNKEIIPVPTLDGLAYNIYNTKSIICPIMDARRSQVYTSLYEWVGGELHRFIDYLAVPIEEIIEKINHCNRSAVFLGDGVSVHRPFIEENCTHSVYFAPPCHNMQRAASIGSLGILYAKEGKTESYMQYVPFYIRKSQAEREYAKKRQTDSKD